MFVIGAPRSGTTFLGDCLAAAPSVSYHFEPPVVRDALRRVGSGEWTPSTGARVYQLTYRTLRLFDGKPGTDRVADKTPENAFAVDMIASTFPSARFIHLVRDGRDVAASLAEKGWLDEQSSSPRSAYRGPSPRFWVEPGRAEEFRAAEHLRRCAWAWRRYTEAAISARRFGPGRYAEIRYEDLVTSPATTAGSVAAFLELSPLDGRRLAEAAGEARADSVGRWRERLAAADLAVVEAEAGPLLVQLGYELFL